MSSDPPSQKLSELRKLVKEEPEDLALRFVLGECLFRLEQYQEAIPELQKARMHPHFKRQAMQLLADAFEIRGFYDLSAKVRNDIDDEFPDDDGPAGAGVPTRLNPTSPKGTSAAKKFPPEEEQDA